MRDGIDDEDLLDEYHSRLIEVVDWWAPRTLATFGAVALGIGIVAAALMHIVVVRILALNPPTVSWGEVALAVLLISLLILPVVFVLNDLTKSPDFEHRSAVALVAANTKVSGLKKFAVNFTLTILVWLPMLALRYTDFGVPPEGIQAVFLYVGAAMTGAAFGQMLLPRFLLRWGGPKTPAPS